jgi:hypothetical protein
MPRRGRSPSPSGRRSYGTSSSSSSKPKTQTQERQSAPPPAPAHTAPHPAPVHQTPPMATPMGGGGGGSFLGRVAELGAGIAVGHVAGRALENVFFGGHHASPQQLEKAEEEVRKGPCATQYDTFLRCLQKNEDDASKCDWVFDMFKDCQSNNRSRREFAGSSAYGDDYKEEATV